MAQAFNINAQLNIAAPRNLAAVVQQVQSQISSIRGGIDLKLAPGAVQALAEVRTRALAGQAALDGMSRTGALTATQMALIGRAARESASGVEELGKAIGLAFRRFASYGIATAGIVALSGAMRSGVRDAIVFERQMVRFRQVSGATASDIAALRSEIGRLSTSLGTSSHNLAETAVNLRQAGLSIQESRQALSTIAQASLVPGFEDVKQTTAGAIAIMKQFGHSVQDLNRDFSAIAAVSRQYGTEASEITQAVQRMGGVFRAAGGDLNELIALFATVRGTTRQSAESIATGMRTIFTRIERGGTIEALQQMGVNLRYTAQEADRLGRAGLANQFVGPYEAIRRLSEALNQIPSTDRRFSGIIELLGGYRQVQNVIPLIQNMAGAQRAYNLALFGSVPISQTAAQAQDALLVRATSLGEKFRELFRNITQDTAFRSFASSALHVAEALIRLTDALRPVLPMLSALAAIKVGSSIINAVRGAQSFVTGVYAGASGTGPRRYARGGVVPGSGNTDSEPAMLMPGEFVIRKRAAQSIGYDRLHALNSGTQRYASGGEVIPLKSGVHVGQLFLEGANAGTGRGVSVGSDKNIIAQIQAVTKLNPENAKLIASKFKFNDRVEDYQMDQKRLAPIFRGKVMPRIVDAIDNSIAAYTPSGARGGKFSLATNQNALTTVEGVVFEKFVSVLSGISAANNSDAFDFKPSKGQLRRFRDLFNPQPVDAQYLDAKRTRQPPSKILHKALAENLAGFGPDNIAYAKKLSRNIGQLHQERIAEAEQKLQELRAQATQKKAGGGPIHMAGGDTVPALLTPGEYVLNRDAVSRIGMANLHRMNASGGGPVQHFNRGGVVRMADGGEPPTVQTQTLPLGLAVGRVGASYAESMSRLIAAIENQVRVLLPATSQTEVFRRAMLVYNRAVEASANAERERRAVVSLNAAAERNRAQAGTFGQQAQGLESQIATLLGGGAGQNNIQVIQLQQQLARAQRGQELLERRAQQNEQRSQEAGRRESSQLARSAVVIQRDATGAYSYVGDSRLTAINTSVGRANAPGPGRLSRAGSFIGGNAQQFAFLAALAAPIAIERAYGRFDVSGGEAHNRRAVQGERLTGAVTGAGTGLALGATLGSALGPVGTAVGGVGGALIGGGYGYYSAGREGESRLADLQFDRMAQRVSVALTNVTNNGRPGEADFQTASQNIDELLAGARSRGTRRFVESGSTSTTDFLQQQRDSTQQGLQSALPTITQIAHAAIADLTRRELQRVGAGSLSHADVLSRAGSVVGDFSQSSIGRSALTAISQGTGQSLEVVERNMRRLAEATLQQALASRQATDAQNRMAQARINFDALNKAITGAQSAMQPFDNHLNALNSLFDGRAAQVRALSLSSDLRGIGGPHREAFASAVEQVAGTFGGNEGAEYRRQAFGADALLRTLRAGIDAAASQRVIDPQHSQADTILGVLNQAVRRGTVLDEHVNIVRSRLGEIGNQAGSQGLTRQLQNPEALVQRLTNDVTQRVNATGQTAAKLIEERANSFLQAMTYMQGQLRRIFAEQEKLEENRTNLLRFQVSRIAEFTGRESTHGLDLLTTSQLQNPVTSNLRNLTGLSGGAELDPAIIGRRFNDLFAQSHAALDRLHATPIDLSTNSQWSQAARSFAELNGQTLRVKEALQQLADASKLNAAVQEKLASVNQERSERLSLGDQLLRGGLPAALQFSQGAALARFANAQGHVGNFAPFQRNILFNFLEATRNVRLQGLGGITGGDLHTNLVRNTVPGIANLPAGRQGERQGLLNEMEANLARAAQAQQELVRVQQDLFTQNQAVQLGTTQRTSQLQAAFFQRAESLNATFLSNLRSSLLSVEQTRLEGRQGELRGQAGEVQRLGNQANLLLGVGATDQNLSRFRSQDSLRAFQAFFNTQAQWTQFAERLRGINFGSLNPLGDNGNGAAHNRLLHQGLLGDSTTPQLTQALNDQLNQLGFGGNQLPDNVRQHVIDSVASGYIRARANPNAEHAQLQRNLRISQEHGTLEQQGTDTRRLNEFENRLVANLLHTALNEARNDLGREHGEARRTVLNQTGVRGTQASNLLATLSNEQRRGEFLQALNNGALTNLSRATDSLTRITSELHGIEQQLQRIALVGQPVGLFRRGTATPHADGGQILSFRPHGTDTVPAMLTPGEFVVRREMAARYGSQLRAMNAGRFANGGLVPGQSVHGLLNSLDDQQLARLYDRGRQFGVQAIYGQLGTFSSIANNRRAGANLQRGALASLQAMMGAVSNNVEDRQGRIAYLEHLPPQAQQALLAYHTRVSQVFAGFDGMGLPQLQQYYMRRIIPRLNVWLPQVLRRIEANQRLVDRNPNNRQAERMLTILTKYRDFYEGFPLQLSEVIGFHGAQGEQELRDYVKRFNIGPALGDLWRPEMPAAGGVLAPVIPTLGQLQDNVSRADNRTGAVVTASPRAPRRAPRAAFTSGVGVGGRVLDVIGNTSKLEGFAHGGYVYHGHGKADSVHARLSQGEYVLRPDAVSAIGKKNLDSLNQNAHRFAGGGHVGYYADGGSVGAAGNLASNPAAGNQGAALAAVLAAFGGATATLANSFHVFAGNATALTKALEAMPHTITFNGQLQHQHTFQGLEPLNNLGDSLRPMVEGWIADKIRDVMKDKFRDAGPLNI